MPTYSYVCKKCEHSFDLWQAEAETLCPKCGGELRKVFGQLGVSFKGTGFYRTDSRPTESSKPKSSD